MKNIKNFNQYNESIRGGIQRSIDPYRKESDDKVLSLFKDIIEDYEKYNDLKKVKIIDDGGTSISLDKVRIGKDYTLSYVFGKYHPVLRDIHSGNREAGDRRIKIKSIPFSVTIRKNELEKMFNTNRINLGKVKVEDIKTNHNYDRNPNIGNNALFKEKIDEYNISSDIANQIFNYFINEFKSKYPDLDKSKYKGSMSIRDIERSVKTEGIIDTFTHCGISSLTKIFGKTISQTLEFSVDLGPIKFQYSGLPHDSLNSIITKLGIHCIIISFTNRHFRLLQLTVNTSIIYPNRLFVKP